MTHGLLEFIFAVAVTVAVKEYFSNRVDNAESRLDELIELNADEYPGQCISYGKLRENTEVRAYHQKIVSQCRKPVMGEYLAAMEWVESADQRKTEFDF